MKLNSKTETKIWKQEKKITNIENFISKNKWKKNLKINTENNKSAKTKSKLGK